METTRRTFLKLGGVCTLGLGTLPIVNALGKTDPEPKFVANTRELTARRWAMAIDLKACWERGDPKCRECTDACHTTHNVPDIGNRQHEVKWIWSESYGNVFWSAANPYMPLDLDRKPVMVLCNHCAEAPCVRVCPTQATFKRADGITVIDYHRCIGCRFCMAACPYGARSFNFFEPRPYIKTELNPRFPTRDAGVVEKCNFCEERLSMGQIPACVEACNKEARAMYFGDLEDPGSEVRRVLAQRYSIRRRPELGTGPGVFYLI
ncbi:MAG TPA: 4Fe-4S dicluster domain-containing protein [Syntrophobacteraceae bacterium]|nr:4Fe-4S dicluster domain-containing protein [Syntrophobacteraceae bacterium]